jgi:hypothetical protein
MTADLSAMFSERQPCYKHTLLNTKNIASELELTVT